MIFVRFANVMNNTAIITTFNSDNINIVNIKKQHCRIIRIIRIRILKFKSMIKKTIVADNTFFTVITFSRINSFTGISSLKVQHL